MLDSPTQQIKERLDIVEVISSYIKLQKAGANYRALCPFHSEKTPSFFVSPARQIWHCFGCSKGGDIFGFVKEIEGVEFGDALRILAQKAGVELKRQDPKLTTERTRLYEICELSTRFFEKQLEASKVGQEARKYILARGINEESIRKWRLGYAPDTWQGLSDFLVGKGYKREEVEGAGLAIKKEQGSWYDRFRGRIIFPIFDLNSQVVGFGGRVFSDSKRPDGQTEAKYINIPNTLIYDKSRLLYGLDKAKMEIRKKDFCILVEGYTDTIMVSQAGFENVVATSGTALTFSQLRLLKRYAENLFTAFDMDIAGDSATKRGIDLAQNFGFNIKVVMIPEGKDPADFVAKNQKEFGKLIEKAKSILEFYFETTFNRFDKKTVEGKKQISKILLPVLKRIPNKIEQDFWVQKLAKELAVSQESIFEELKKLKVEKEVFFEEHLLDNSKVEKKERDDLLFERLISFILKKPELISLVTEEQLTYFSSRFSEIISDFKNYFNNSQKLENFQPEFVKFLEKKPKEEKDFWNYLSLMAEIEDSELDLEKEFKKCLLAIKVLKTKKRLEDLSQKIEEAEGNNDQVQIKALTEEFNELTKKLR